MTKAEAYVPFSHALYEINLGNVSGWIDSGIFHDDVILVEGDGSSYIGREAARKVWEDHQAALDLVAYHCDTFNFDEDTQTAFFRWTVRALNLVDKIRFVVDLHVILFVEHTRLNQQEKKPDSKEHFISNMKMEKSRKCKVGLTLFTC